jgi:hypothetical protein
VTSDASVLVGRITAQGTSNAGDRLALWLQGTQAIAAIATTLGVLIALYVAVVREPRKWRRTPTPQSTNGCAPSRCRKTCCGASPQGRSLLHQSADVW